jgi:tetratricopeptide (TPR) repeat protein
MKRVAVIAPLCVLLLFLCCHPPLLAQAGFGDVSFPNSGVPAAQADFLLGLAQLHDFEYNDAAEHFRKAQQLDPGFAMAYWGEAMTKNHPVWHQQDLAAAREILSRLGSTPDARLAKAVTKREKLYLQSIEILYGEGTKEDRDQKYEAAMAGLHREFPNDVDATSFYALSILGTAENGRDFATYMRAAAILEEVFPTHPRHPGVVHYLIHCYDDPIHAPLGLRPARIYSQIAPDAGHALHMTSHIFLALGMWDDVVKANETAISVVNRNRRKDGQPDVMCGHYNYWLEYAYLQLGRTADARRVLEGCRVEAQSESAGANSRKGAVTDPDASSVGSYAQMRTIFLINTRLWDDVVARWTMPPGEYPAAQLTFDYGSAIAVLESHNSAASRAAAAQVERDRQQSEAWLNWRKIEASEERQRALIITQQVNALLLSEEGNSADAVVELQHTAKEEHNLPMDFGPPFIDKPTDELLGEMLLQLRRPDDARSAFQMSLSRAPGRRMSEVGNSKTAAAGAAAAKTSAQQGPSASTNTQAHNH